MFLCEYVCDESGLSIEDVEYVYILESAASAKRRPAVGPVPCVRLIIPRGRDPFSVVGSVAVEFVGFGFQGNLLLVLVKGRRRSQQRKILMICELTVVE